MQLGFVSAILPDLKLDELTDFAVSRGYDCIELMCWPVGKAERRYAGVTHIDVSSLSKSYADEIHETFAAAGIFISALGYYPNVLSPDANEAKVAKAHLKKVIKAASTLGIATVNTFIGRNYKLSLDDNWKLFRKVWPAVIKYAEDCNVRVAIENCPMLFSGDEWPGGKNMAVSPAIWRRMFDEIPSKNFGLNYDPSHMIWQCMDYIAPLKEFASKLFHVHAKDLRVDRDRLNDVGILATPLEYHNPKLPGLGEVNWGRFISVLGDAGYGGPVCVEVEDRCYEGSLAARQAALSQSATYLRNFIAEAQ